MLKKLLKVLLIEDNAEYAELVRRWLSAREDTTFVLNWTDSLMEGMNSLTLGGVDVIVLDLGLPDSDGLNTFTTVKTFAPGVPIIVLSGGDSESLALRMVQEGAQDYLVKSACNSDLLAKALQYAVVRYSGPTGKDGGPRSPDQTKVIGVIGAKGGVGATTVACNLGIEVRRQTGQKTLLADLDLNAGLVSFLTNLESDFSMLDAISNLHRLDISCWEGIVSHGAGDLHIVRSPGLLGASEVDVDKLRHVLTLLQTYYRWIVLDLGRLTCLSRMLLQGVTDLFVVTTTSVPALYEAKRLIGVLRRADFNVDRIRLIVNRHERKQGYTGSDLDRLFGIPVYAKLPVASRELNEACVKGRALPESSDFRMGIANLARKVANIQEEKSKNVVSQLFSFADKFR